MKQYKNASFVKLFLRFTIVFFIAVVIFKTVVGFFQFDGLEGLKNTYFVDGKWQPFLGKISVISLIYGLFMAGYYKFIKK